MMHSLEVLMRRNLEAAQREYDYAIDEGNFILAERIAVANPGVVTLDKQNANPDEGKIYLDPK